MRAHAFVFAVFSSFLFACGDDAANESGSANPENPVANTGTSAGESAANGSNGGSAKKGCLTDPTSCTLETVATDLANGDAIAVADGTLWVSTAQGLVRIKGADRKRFTFGAGASRLEAIGSSAVWQTSSRIERLFGSAQFDYVAKASATLGAPKWLQTFDGKFYFTEQSSWISEYAAGATYPHRVQSISSDTQAFAIDARGVVRVDGDRNSEVEIVDDTRGTQQWKVLAKMDHGWITGMAITASHAFIAVHDDSTIRTIPRDGGSLSILADVQADVFSLKVDGSGVYWTSREGVRWASLDATETRLLAKVEWKSFVGKVALGPDAIYVSDPGAGTVSRLMK